MRLISVRIKNYRSIEDSGVVPVDRITCLVGKNESGKTAFLQALHLLNPLNPLNGKTRFHDVMDYPSRRFSDYKKVRDDEPANVVTAEFDLSDSEVAAVADEFGRDVLRGRRVTVTAGYTSTETFAASYNERAAIKHLVAELELPASDRDRARTASTVASLVSVLREVDEPHSTVTDLLSRIGKWRDQRLALHLIDTYWSQWLPQFFYFDDYSTMRGRASLPNIAKKKANETLDEADRTFLALLTTVDADLTDFETLDFELLTRELEGAANGITDQVFRYWTQNQELEVRIAISQANPEDEAPLDRGPVVNVRIYNPRHRVTVPFDERSRGFVWFFSFFAYFSNIEKDPSRETILLLDEPGLSLHATAQADFLRFIEERLAADHQVLYTTHSPFLIDPSHLVRVRTVQDVAGEGTKVTADVFRTDSETVFPLQTALGYDLAQTLFVGPHCLLVEGPSDLIYLQVLSQVCQDRGLSTLDERWVVTPVGGADKLSTFVSLLGGNQLDIAVLMDASTKDKQRIQTLQENGYLGRGALVQVSEFTASKDADIEDLFDVDFYLKLVNGAYAGDLKKPLTAKQLKVKGGRVTRRIDQHFADNHIANNKLNHYRPAAYLLREQVALLSELDEDTIQRAATMFERLNDLLP